MQDPTLGWGFLIYISALSIHFHLFILSRLTMLYRPWTFNFMIMISCREGIRTKTYNGINDSELNSITQHAHHHCGDKAMGVYKPIRTECNENEGSEYVHGVGFACKEPFIL